MKLTSVRVQNYKGFDSSPTVEQFKAANDHRDVVLVVTMVTCLQYSERNSGTLISKEGLRSTRSADGLSWTRHVSSILFMSEVTDSLMSYEVLSWILMR